MYPESSPYTYTLIENDMLAQGFMIRSDKSSQNDFGHAYAWGMNSYPKRMGESAFERS